MTHLSKTLSVTIRRPPDMVYAFVSNPENLPQWATAFCLSARKTDGEWIVETTAGPMTVRFVEPNAYGVLDHTVTVINEVEVHVPMRVFANGDGSEVVFTLFQQAYMNDIQFAQDISMVERDLRTLKLRMES